MTTEMDLLRRVDPAPETLPTGARAALLAELRSSPPEPRRTWRRATVVTACSTAALALTGGLAYALVSRPAATTVGINCSAGVTADDLDTDGRFTAVVPAASGDPVADCAARYAQLGQQPPALRAYDDGSSVVQVLPSSWAVPDGWRPLSPGFRSDVDRLALQQHVDDPVDGPAARCLSTEAAEQLVRSYVAQLRLVGWTVVQAPGTPADGASRCASAVLDGTGASRVLVQAGPPAPVGSTDDDLALQRLVTALRDRVASACLDLPDAERTARELVADSPVRATVSTRQGTTGACTAVDLVTGGGSLQVVLS